MVNYKLKTQDRLRQWDVDRTTNLNLLCCPLRDILPDSHTHLFFESPFSLQVWSRVRDLGGMENIPPRFDDVVKFLIPSSKGFEPEV